MAKMKQQKRKVNALINHNQMMLVSENDGFIVERKLGSYCTEPGCNLKFLSYAQLLVHINRHHLGAKAKSFSIKQQPFDKVLKGNKVPKAVLCKLCDTYIEDRGYNRHFENCFYWCQFCAMSLGPAEDYKAHEASSSHEENMRNLVPVSRRGSSKAVGVRKTIKDTKECGHCDQRSKAAIRYHRRLHKIKPLHECNLCQCVFEHKYDVLAHKRKQHTTTKTTLQNLQHDTKSKIQSRHRSPV